MNYDVIIIGAGVIGGMVARELSRFDLKICLLERRNDVATGASKANSGIVHGGFDPEPDTLKAKLNVEGVPLLYKAAEELHVPCKNNGSIVCAFGKKEEEALKELYDRGIANGVLEMKLLSGDEAREIEPNLSKDITKVLQVPTAGIICPYDLTIAAIGNAMDNGADLKLNFNVTKIDKTENGFAVYSEKGESIGGKYVINCAGAYSDKIAELLDDKFFEIIPRAGEYMLLDKTAGNLVSHTIFRVPTAEGKGVLVSPTVDGNLLTGPTAVKVECPECTETTSEGISAVLKTAGNTVPAVDFRKVITSFSGVRSSEANGDFIIKMSEKADGLVHVAAIDSPGLSSSVSIAKYVVELLKKDGLQLNENPNFNPHRPDMHAFRHMTDDEKDAFIKKNPLYGKTVCRCENVSEGEIRAAINQNPKPRDVDGIKRRTRSGMGRCQGGFCLPFVIRLLAEESGVDESEITKNGEGSNYILERL